MINNDFRSQSSRLFNHEVESFAQGTYSLPCTYVCLVFCPQRSPQLAGPISQQRLSTKGRRTLVIRSAEFTLGPPCATRLAAVQGNRNTSQREGVDVPASSTSFRQPRVSKHFCPRRHHTRQSARIQRTLGPQRGFGCAFPPSCL